MANMDYSSIVLRFIRSDEEKASTAADDHLLKIKRNYDNFIWSYCETDRTKAQYMELEDGAAVLGSLERMFHLLSWDKDPYENIQVVAPGFPMVMLEVADMSEWWPTLRPFLAGIFENWPLNTTQEKVRLADDDLANPAIDEREESVSDSESEAEEGECDNYNCGCIEDDDDTEDADYEDDDDKTDPDMPGLISQEDARIADLLLRILREPAPSSTKRRVTPEPVDANTILNTTQWYTDAENREPIEIRRVVNTPEGPRTHVRYV